MDSPDFEVTFHPMDEVEPIQLYCPGGYHPVHLGDKFNDRYTIEHKLGYGGYSTVWLARDPQKRLVALKIMVAAKPGDVDYEDILQEASFLRRLKPQPGASIGRPLSGVLYSSHTTPPSFFPTLLDEFIIQGPNGEHRCLVTDVLGPSLGGLTGDDRLYAFPVKLARRIAVQLAQAVAELHECGIVHGDLHPGNILLRVPGMEAWTDTEVRNYLGEPEQVAFDTIRQFHPDLETRHVPQYLVYNPPVSNVRPLCLESPAITIIDFGLAFYSSGSEQGVHKIIGAPPSFAAPEVQLKDALTPACDVWSLGCLVYSLFTRDYMWLPKPGYHDTLLSFTLCYGKLPEPWWGQWKERETFYSKDGELKQEMKGRVPVVRIDLESMLRYLRKCARGMGKDEYAWLKRVMLEIFKLDPTERMVAKEILRYLPPQWWAEVEKKTEVEA